MTSDQRGAGVRIVLAALAALALIAHARAAAPAPAGESAAAPREYSSEHRGSFGGQAIAYRAIAGETILKDAQGKPAASVFSFSYIKQTAQPAATRPVLFIFNGGPGSSSMWLHLGFLGPRTLVVPDAVSPPTVPPFALVDNPLSPLDQADLVFIDPVGTGYSRLLADGRAEDFFGVNQDAASITQFIEDWLKRFKRWNSPKYLVGESYGTVRAAVLANTLMGGALPPNKQLVGVTLDGVILLGAGFETGASTEDRHYAAVLTTMAATACYHGKVACADGRADALVARARAFASNDYLRALFMGTRLDRAGRARIADELAALTGVAAKVWLEHDLRLTPRDFSALLLADDGRQFGIYDSRYSLPAPAGAGDPVADDAAMAQYTPGFIAAFNDYAATELTVPPTQSYLPIAFSQVNSRWDWGQGPGVVAPRNYALELAKAMRRNPSLRLFVGTGYFDFATPMGNSEFAITHSGMQLERVTLASYASGHMLYLEQRSAAQLAADLRRFIRPARR